ncbi:MAG: hypothetical protein VYA69_02180 [Gemmatimonadota bacterium]|nr:hypothetical protein [Gemmatimonadota bacterium]
MWYITESGNWYNSMVVYVESEDGIAWRKPELVRKLDKEQPGEDGALVLAARNGLGRRTSPRR